VLAIMAQTCLVATSPRVLRLVAIAALLAIVCELQRLRRAVSAATDALTLLAATVASARPLVARSAPSPGAPEKVIDRLETSAAPMAASQTLPSLMVAAHPQATDSTIASPTAVIATGPPRRFGPTGSFSVALSRTSRSDSVDPVTLQPGTAAATSSQRKAACLKQVPQFESVANDDGFLATVAESMIERRFDALEKVIRQGDFGETMYFIVEGSVDVYVNSIRVRTLSTGNYFGEVALLYGTVRTASCVATEATVCYELGRDALLWAMDERPSIRLLALALHPRGRSVVLR
jgi:hypothetical protein